MKKKIIRLIVINLLIMLSISTNVLAVEGTNSGNEQRRELKNEVKNELNTRISTISGAVRRLFKNTKVAIEKGTLKSKNGTTLIITKDNKDYTILTDSNTQLRRRFWGKTTLDEMQTGDELTIIGKWTDETQTTIQARLVRDLSIQKRFGVFFGTVKTLNSIGWVMGTINRGDQSVVVGSTTKFINRKGQTITRAEIIVDHRVRVRGLWNSKLNTITEITEVKDFSLPPFPSITPTKTP